MFQRVELHSTPDQLRHARHCLSVKEVRRVEVSLANEGGVRVRTRLAGLAARSGEPRGL